jgi:hypothetical protein
MTTPPTDKGKGKQLLYSQENSPQPSPIPKPRYTSSPPTAVIQLGDSTPSPISPNVADDFAMTSSAPLRRTLSSESSKLRKEIEANPEPVIKTEPTPTPTLRSPTPPSQQAVRVEPAALIKSEDEPQRSTPLDRYWTEDRRRRMFRAEPTPEPTEPRPTESPYKRKFVTTRLLTPIKDEPMLSPAMTLKPESSALPPPADTTSPPSVSKTLAWKLPKRDQFGTTPTPIQRHFKIPKRSPSPPPPRGPSPPCPPTPPSPSFRGSSPGPLPPQPNPILGDEESLQGKEPTTFDRDRQKTDGFLHEVRLYQFVNATHPIMTNPWQKTTHALTYMDGPEIYEWK